MSVVYVESPPDDRLADLVMRVAGVSVPLSALRDLRGTIGGLRGMLRETPAVLSERTGLAVDAIQRLRDALELACVAGLEADERPVIRGASDVYARLAHLSLASREELWVVVLDGANRVVSIQRIREGDADAVHVSPVDVLGHSLRAGARRILLAHNHPSGLATPSHEDLAFTRNVVRAGRVLGIAVLDHVVIGAGQWTSLRDSSLLPFPG